MHPVFMVSNPPPWIQPVYIVSKACFTLCPSHFLFCLVGVVLYVAAGSGSKTRSLGLITQGQGPICYDGTEHVELVNILELEPIIKQISWDL